MTISNISKLVDDLGILKAEIADLAAKEKTIKEQLIEAGVGAYDGDFFRASVSVSQRETLDADACRAKLSPQFIAAHTKVTDVTTIRVTARVQDRKAA